MSSAKIKILNLYCGIGGNRLLWENCEVTAVELNIEIARIYHKYYPNDKVIVADAHKYLEKHYNEFDFIWSSPPCPSHSKMRRVQNKYTGAKLPDMRLFSEIIFMKNYCSDIGWVIENVQPYYDLFIYPTLKIGRNLFWTNFKVKRILYPTPTEKVEYVIPSSTRFGFSLVNEKLSCRKDVILRNLIDPTIGKLMLDSFLSSKNNKLFV